MINKNIQAIYAYVLNNIIDGTFPLHYKIPTEQELAAKFQTDRMNAHQAIKILENKKIVMRNKKQGTLVMKIPNVNQVKKLRSLVTQKVCVIDSAQKKSEMHWNEMALLQMEKFFKKFNCQVHHVTLPNKLTQTSFKQFILKLSELEASAIVFLAHANADFYIKNSDEIFSHFENVLLYEEGKVPIHHWPFHSICLDPLHEGIIAANFIIEQEFSKVVYCYMDDYSHRVEQRCRGLQLGAKSEPGEQLFEQQTVKFDKEDPVKNLLSIVRKSKSDCILVAADDKQATYIIDAFDEKGLWPQKDFSIMGFGNNSELKYYNLTTIAPPIENVGETIARVVSKSLLGKIEFSKIQINVRSELIERYSCRSLN